MKKTELVLREILYQNIEKKNTIMTQASLATRLQLSLSTVNAIISMLAKMGAVEIHQRNFHTFDTKKILYYWASIRNPQKDILFATRVEKSVKEIEKQMPDDVIFGSYSAYKFFYNDVPADYSEVYVYGTLDIKKRFPQKMDIPNLFVLKKDLMIETYGKTTTIAQTFVDLWNVKEWYAKEFIKAMEERLHGILE